MAWSLVQSKSNGATGGTVTSTNPTVTLASAPTAGNLIVVCLQATSGPASYTDPSGYTRRASEAASSTSHTVIIVSKIAGAAESATITFPTAISTTWSVFALEFSGNAASGSEFDAVSAGATSAGTAVTTIQPGSLTPAQTGELMVACAGYTSTRIPTITSSYVLAGGSVNAQSCVVGYKFKADALAENPTFGVSASSSAMAAIQVAFNPAAVASGPIQFKSQLSGFF